MAPNSDKVFVADQLSVAGRAVPTTECERKIGYAGGFKIPHAVIEKKLQHQTRRAQIDKDTDDRDLNLHKELATKDDVLSGLQLKPTRLQSK